MTPHLLFPAGQPVQEVVDPLLHENFVPKAVISGGFLPCPTPDRLIGVEVKAVARRVHQLYALRNRVYQHCQIKDGKHERSTRRRPYLRHRAR